MLGWFLCAFWFVFALCALDSSHALAQPNIILVIGDDHGWPYYGFQESSHALTNGTNVQHVVQTPNLDSLAASGTTFSRGFATGSVCTPSLQTLLSAHGHQWVQWQNMVEEVRRTIPMTDQEQDERRWNRYADNLPRRLGEQGYRRWEGGKLWAGLVSDAGFDEGLATYVEEGPMFLSGGSNFGRDGWSVDACGSTKLPGSECPALDPLRGFLDGVGGQPFFVWFAPMLPHAPWDAPADYRDPLIALGLSTPEVDHLSNIRWFDELLGELLGELDIRGLRGDTLVIYLSDNGWGMGLQILAGMGRGKGTLYDLGFRTPIIFSQPGVVPAGMHHPDFVSFSDIPATILDYAGAPAVEQSEGISLRGRIHGGPALGRDGLALFARNRNVGGGAWVGDQWRYLQFNDGREELYRIDLDPFEENDLASDNPELIEQFAARVDERRSELSRTPKSVDVRGWVRDSNGAPIAGAQLRLSGGAQRIDARTDEAGRFRFATVPASNRLALKRSRGLRGRLSDFASGIGVRRPFFLPGLFLPLQADVGRGAGSAGAARVSGRILTPDGTPVAHARVQIRRRGEGGKLSLVTLSQEDGAYLFESLPEVAGYQIGAKAAKHRKASAVAVDLSVDPETRDVDLVLTPRG